jgi:RNA polymerase sigma-70 factor (ECF subfamily)
MYKENISLICLEYGFGTESGCATMESALVLKNPVSVRGGGRTNSPQSAFRHVATGVDLVTRTPEHVDEPELVARAQAGDSAAYEELVRHYQARVLRTVAHFMYNCEDVEDAASEVFVLAYRGIRSFKGSAAFSTWLYRIAVNSAMRAAKKKRPLLSIDDLETGLGRSLVDTGSEDPHRGVQENEKRQAVRKAVTCLPEKQRVVVVLHYFESLSCEQTAEVVGCSLGTVWSRLHYACKALKGELSWLVD